MPKTGPTTNGNGKAAKSPVPGATAAKVSAPAKPRLVNRGPAGLLTKLKPGAEKQPTPETPVQPGVRAKYQIAPALSPLAVPIDSVTYDPDNARLHPERNMESIELSLTMYGQVKPIVVQKSTGKVVAGNGTLAAAKKLGFTRIAAAVVDMTDIEATGYGLADNRTAELAKWDFEVVARLDRLLQEAGHQPVGWSPDELEVLRAAEWIPPPISEGGFGGEDGGNEPLLVGFDQDEYGVVGPAIARMREIQQSPEMSQAAALRLICQEWASWEPKFDENGDFIQPEGE